MKALNAASLTPLSVLCERRAEIRKTSSLPTVSPLKFSHYESLSASRSAAQEGLLRTLRGGVVLLSSVLGTGIARALTYEEALEKSASPFSSDFDVNGILDSVIRFGTENPTIIAGGVTVLAVPLILSLLLDIRAAVDFRQVGSPDIKGLSKKPASIVYKSEDKPGFLKKLSLKFKEPENITLFILDKFDGNSELVAELVAVNGFKAAYAIKDGAEGPRGWMNSGLPWIPPKKAFSLDLGDLSDTISGAFGEGSDALLVTFTLSAAAGLGVLALSEMETILQVLGSAALIQFTSKKLLFAEDRKQTLEQVDEFLTTKIAPKELVGELKDIGKALLPVPVTRKVLPAPSEPETAVADSTAQNAEAAVADSTAQNAEAASQINSVPITEAKAETASGFSRPLSPYPYYPDFKPPTSPTPSKP
ncbi:RHODANESE-LIKE DOMAIN-CONTAINING PROTEIN 4 CHLOROPLASTIC [Salix koriyanagi]|uniref:RHODANESE-LIKE DOMAIN-CONTAINING PROTEIN 4 CHLOROPLASTIC n=1 Tax=Salix koriyanagi TaxID=2511006 RepID=A0A9Q0YU37_9ROSI|nr:RHODANESE-LIKE DOMAIN-CONTAINING PROTEIN 4 CHLOROPLASTIC [Salix koriyanagi]